MTVLTGPNADLVILAVEAYFFARGQGKIPEQRAA
ncbi:MAG: hypothetical protein JWM16_1624 [Verrucomicrobiales bacterium]|nr:hypothetical protein [Verrucomicrobiales bacterium]